MATKLVSMKMSKAEREGGSKSPDSVAIDRPIYPWGLSITLDEDALGKLDLEALPEVGKEMTLYAKVDVTSVSSHESADGGGPRRSLSLQITEMCLESGAAGKSLYEE